MFLHHKKRPKCAKWKSANVATGSVSTIFWAES
jgi:hypothetical protein